MESLTDIHRRKLKDRRRPFSQKILIKNMLLHSSKIIVPFENSPSQNLIYFKKLKTPTRRVIIKEPYPHSNYLCHKML